MLTSHSNIPKRLMMMFWSYGLPYQRLSRVTLYCHPNAHLLNLHLSVFMFLECMASVSPLSFPSDAIPLLFLHTLPHTFGLQYVTKPKLVLLHPLFTTVRSWFKQHCYNCTGLSLIEYIHSLAIINLNCRSQQHTAQNG
jgi:hypothetical protein